MKGFIEALETGKCSPFVDAVLSWRVGARRGHDGAEAGVEAREHVGRGGVAVLVEHAVAVLQPLAGEGKAVWKEQGGATGGNKT